MMDKNGLRKEMCLRQMRLDDEYVNAASSVIEQKVLNSAAYNGSHRIFCYVSMNKEPDTFGIIKAAFNDGKEVFVPKCVSKTEMLAVKISAFNELSPGRMGILEPEEMTETKPASEFDFIIVPCVSVSLDGRRLGHGAGYYDRFLAEYSGKAVCLCFSEMVSEEIPITESDIIIPEVITEKGKRLSSPDCEALSF